jgi:hypothetical protein
MPAKRSRRLPGRSGDRAIATCETVGAIGAEYEARNSDIIFAEPNVPASEATAFNLRASSSVPPRITLDDILNLKYLLHHVHDLFA